jgi:urease accessory protein
MRIARHDEPLHHRGNERQTHMTSLPGLLHGGSEEADRRAAGRPGWDHGHQRAVGLVDIVLQRRGDVTGLRRLHQAGCLKARLPRVEMAGQCNIVTMNISGGIAGGDRLDQSIELAAGCRAVMASQAAERIYRALPDSAPARIGNVVELAAGARLDWLPQETIIFDQARLQRRLRVTMAADACFTGVEMMVFGRAAMGERVRWAEIDDRIVIWRGGRLLVHDAIRLRGAVGEMLARPAVGQAGRAMATIIHVAPDAEALLGDVRQVLDQAALSAGATHFDGVLLARMVANSVGGLRASVQAVLMILRQGAALPRVWQC